jgi:hypothetical protein
MSSLNPFAARRERKEQQMKDKMAELQAGAAPAVPNEGSFIESEELTDEKLASMLPQSSSGYEDLGKFLPAAAKTEQPSGGWSLPGGGEYEPPSRMRQCMHKLQNGFVIGASLGGAVGFMYGTYAAIAYKHVLYLPIAVVQAAGGFGFFLACGTVIRCEEPHTWSHESDAFWLTQEASPTAPFVTRKHLASPAIPAAGLPGMTTATTAYRRGSAEQGRSAVLDAVFS